MKVMDWLKERGQKKIYWLPETSRVSDALELMRDKNIGLVVIKDYGFKDVGVFTDRDYARKGELEGRSAFASITEVMTPRSEFLYVTPEADLTDCAEVFQDVDHKPRHLLVMDAKLEEGGKIEGILSHRDLIAALSIDLGRMRFEHFGMPT